MSVPVQRIPSTAIAAFNAALLYIVLLVNLSESSVLVKRFVVHLHFTSAPFRIIAPRGQSPERASNGIPHRKGNHCLQSGENPTAREMALTV